MPSIFDTEARKVGKKSESRQKCEMEEYDPDDPEFDPCEESPVERRGGKRVKNVPKEESEVTVKGQQDDGNKLKGR